MHFKHKASVLYKTAELSVLRSMDMTETCEIAHSLSSEHSLISPLCFVAATEQVSGHRDYTISGLLISHSGHCSGVCTSQNNRASALKGLACVEL